MSPNAATLAGLMLQAAESEWGLVLATDDLRRLRTLAYATKRELEASGQPGVQGLSIRELDGGLALCKLRQYISPSLES